MMIRHINLAIITALSIGVAYSYTSPKCRMLNGYEGECRYLDRCKPLFELNEKLVKTDLELLFLRQSTCGTSSNYRYKVCCPPQSEWWRELEIDPILFPELVNFLNNGIPIPVTTDKAGTTSSVNLATWNTNQGYNFGQTSGTKRPPLYVPTAPNANSYGFDDSSQKFNKNNAQRVGQISSNGQTTWNSNNLGFVNNKPQRTERPQGHGGSNANTYENNASLGVSQTSSTGQTTGNGNSQGFGNDQWQKGSQTPTVDQTWNANVDRQENDQSQRVGQTSSKGPFSEHPYKFDRIMPQKVGVTASTSQVLPTTSSHGTNNGQSQVNQQTTPKVQMDLNANDQTQLEETASNSQSTPNVNNQGLDNEQPNVFDAVSNEEIALSVNADEFENNQSPEGQSSLNSGNNPSAQPTKENAERCGVQAAVINRGVVGGEAAPEQYPWLALLEYSGGVVNCGGSLISQTHVLTAAHCVETMRGNPVAVRLSEYNMTTYPVDMATSNNGDSRPISITIMPVEWSKKHPQFGHSHYQHDIGLVKMTRQVAYTDFVRPICLPQTDYTKQFDIKTKLLVAGWGTDSSKIEEVKMDSQESYVPIGICNRMVKRALNSKQMCAGERPSRRPCVGDYGGPLMLETDNAYVVVGVLSYGPNQCAGGSVPDVSTNVYEYLDWINENMVDSDDALTTIQS